MSNRVLPILIFLAILLSACAPVQSTTPVGSPDEMVVDITDLFQTGHDRAIEFLDADSSLKTVVKLRQDQVIMVLIDVLIENDEREQVQQSGVVLGDGSLVLTAGHGFDLDRGTIESIQARGPHGEQRKLTLIRYLDADSDFPIIDWALMKLEKPIQVAPLSLPVDRSSRRPALILGYPSGLGATEQEIVVRAREHTRGSVHPLPLAVKRSPTNRYVYTPLAGTAPLRGISGAPVFNSRGELVAVFSSISRQRTLNSWTYVYHVSEVPWREIEQILDNP